MFATYCQKPHSGDPMAALILGDRPAPKIPEGWVRVKVSHASLNRHVIFTLRGITSHVEGITYPMILGNDGAGTHGSEAARRRQNMIDHIILTVSDFERSVAFYAKALKPLGITNFIDYEGQDGHPDLKGFGDGKRAFFWLKEGKPHPQAVHVGFVAKDHAEVDAFYKAAG